MNKLSSSVSLYILAYRTEEIFIVRRSTNKYVDETRCNLSCLNICCNSFIHSFFFRVCEYILIFLFTVKRFHLISFKQEAIINLQT